MKRIAPWLLPTLIAPVLGAFLYVFFVSQAHPAVPNVAWYVVAAVAAGLSLMVGWMMAAADVTLLKLQLRELPTGWRVWLMGLAAPFPVLWSWQKMARFAITGLPQLVVTVVLPMLLTAVVLRFVLGTRPSNWRDGSGKA